jgi:hypothetical protein
VILRIVEVKWRYSVLGLSLASSFKIRGDDVIPPGVFRVGAGGSKRVTAIDYLARHFRVQRLRNRGGLLAADQAIGKQASDERDTSGDYRC